MSSEAKIGLGIVLGAVLVSVVLIGRTVSRKDAAPDGGTVAAATAEPGPDSPALSETGGWTSAPSSTPGTFGVDGSAMDKLVSGGAPDGLAAAPATAPAAVPAAVTPEAPAVTAVPAYPVAAEVPVNKTQPAAVASAPKKKTGTATLSAPKKVSSGASVSPETFGAAPVAAAAPAGRIHKVQAGETLSILADRFLGKSSRYPEILAANPGLTRNSVLRIGQKIVIPPER